MCWLFKWKINCHFSTLRGAGSPSTAKLQPTKVWKLDLCKNKKIAARGLVWPQIFWPENKSCSFLWIIGKVQNLDLSDKNFASYGYFKLLPISAFDNWGNGRDIFVREVAGAIIYFFPPLKWTPPLTDLMNFSVPFEVPAVIYTPPPPIGWVILHFYQNWSSLQVDSHLLRSWELQKKFQLLE